MAGNKLVLDIGSGENPNSGATHFVDLRILDRENFVRADVKYLPFMGSRLRPGLTPHMS